jgi:hypothetical protein
MKHTIIFIGIILSLSSFAYSNEKIVKYMKNGTTVYYCDSTAATFDETKLNKHIEIFNALHQSIKKIMNKKEVNSLDSLVDTASVIYDQSLKKTRYDNLKKYGISIIKLGDDGFPKFIIFATSPARILNKEEYNLNVGYPLKYP